MEKQGSFSIWQDGIKVAGGSGPFDHVMREAFHYAMMYSEVGPIKVTVKEDKPRKKKNGLQEA